MPQAAADCPLNPREIAIVRALADGKTRAAAGRSVHLSAGSVNNTVARIKRKVGAVNAPSLVATALRNGWIQ